MTGAQVATALILAGFVLLGGIAAYAGAKIAARREAERYTKECIYREWQKRAELREWMKTPPRKKITTKEKKHV